MLFNLDMIQSVYSKIPSRVEEARRQLKRPLTLSEKILYSHLVEGSQTKFFLVVLILLNLTQTA